MDDSPCWYLLMFIVLMIEGYFLAADMCNEVKAEEGSVNPRGTAKYEDNRTNVDVKELHQEDARKKLELWTWTMDDSREEDVKIERKSKVDNGVVILAWLFLILGSFINCCVMLMCAVLSNSETKQDKIYVLQV